MDTNERDATTFPDVLLHLFGAPFRLQTYKNLLYLLLAFPLGLVYFIFLAVGLATGFGLAIVWIGLPLLALVFAGSWALAAFERQAAIHLLGADVAPMLPPPSTEARPSRTIWQQAGDFLRNPVTWKGMGFLLLKLPLGIVSFVAIVGLLTTSSALLLAPIFWAFGDLEIDGQVFQADGLIFQTGGPGGPWLCALIGVGLLFLSFNLLNALALVWRGAAILLLGSERFAAAPPPSTMPPMPDAVAMA
jgi:hypothetical protein